GPGAAGRGRRDPGVPPADRRADAAGRRRPAAVRGRAAPPEDRVRRRHPAGRLPVHRRTLDHRRQRSPPEGIRQRLSAAHGARRRGCARLPLHVALRRAAGAGALPQDPLPSAARTRGPGAGGPAVNDRAMRPLTDLPRDVASRMHTVFSDIDDTLTTPGQLSVEAYAALAVLTP